MNDIDQVCLCADPAPEKNTESEEKLIFKHPSIDFHMQNISLRA